MDLISLENSFDLRKNYINIEEEDFKELNGGRGGDFFLLTHDRKMILKTVNEKEINSLMYIIGKYHSYLMCQEDSLISKIYGIYKVTRNDHKTYSFLIMRNILTLPRDCVIRTYDLKGSTEDREELD